MFSQIKAYLLAAAGVIIAVFVAVFQYRGHKIDTLKKDNDTHKDNADKLVKAIEAQKKEIEIREKVQEIMSEPDDVVSAADRLRSRSKSRNSHKDKL